MGLWFFLTACVLLLPVLMIGLGGYYRTHAPKTISDFVGYRTALSRKNRDTWVTAHHLFGRWFFTLGWPLLFASALMMLLLYPLPQDDMAWWVLLLSFVQCVFLFLPIFLTERDLRRVFNKDGSRKTQ